MPEIISEFMVSELAEIVYGIQHNGMFNWDKKDIYYYMSTFMKCHIFQVPLCLLL